MSIFVAREWFRHVIGFARNEVSRRYVTEKPEFFIPTALRSRAENVKQGSDKESIANNEEQRKKMAEFCTKAVEYYYQLIEQEHVCQEQARMILPQSMYTEFIETASLSAYGRLVKLRDKATAQKEIQDYAKEVSQLIEPHFPVSWKALMAS